VAKVVHKRYLVWDLKGENKKQHPCCFYNQKAGEEVSGVIWALACWYPSAGSHGWHGKVHHSWQLNLIHIGVCDEDYNFSGNVTTPSILEVVRDWHGFHFFFQFLLWSLLTSYLLFLIVSSSCHKIKYQKPKDGLNFFYSSFMVLWQMNENLYRGMFCFSNWNLADLHTHQ
jgi:hypothetical protein